MDEHARSSRLRADFKTKAHQHCMKRMKDFAHNLPKTCVNENSLVQEEAIYKATGITDFLKSARAVVKGKEVIGLRRWSSACDVNEKRNKYIVEYAIPDATKTLWPMDSELMREADIYIAEKLNWSTALDISERLETVGNHIIEVGVIYGPERFYVKPSSSSKSGIEETLGTFNLNIRKIKEMSEVKDSSDLSSPSLLAFCNEFDQVLKRVCYVEDENKKGFYLYDFDYGNVCHLKSLENLTLKHLPTELQVDPPLYSPVQLVNTVSEADFTRYINNLKKTGFLYIVGFAGPEIKAATTSEVQMPNPCRRFCDYLYCQGDCFLIYEEKQLRRQNPQM